MDEEQQLQQPQFIFNNKARAALSERGKMTYYAKDEKTGQEKMIDESMYDSTNPLHRTSERVTIIDPETQNPLYVVRRSVSNVKGEDGKITQQERFNGHSYRDTGITTRPEHDLRGDGAQAHLRSLFYDPTTDVPNIHLDGRGFVNGNDADRYRNRIALIKQMNSSTPAKKQGGLMNRPKYFQQGGAAPQQDMQQQVIALVQAAMQGDQKATETVNKIMEAAKAGDQQAIQLAQMIQAVAEQMQSQATAAKWGAKLNYIRSLKYAKGGKTCSTCNKEIEMKKCGGKKAKKRYFGGWL